MTTAQDPGCTCGAAEFGPDVPHKEVCYISLAKDAEAVTDAPVRQVGASERKRTAIPLPPASEIDFTHIEWVEGLDPQITEIHATGVAGHHQNRGRYWKARQQTQP